MNLDGCNTAPIKFLALLACVISPVAEANTSIPMFVTVLTVLETPLANDSAKPKLPPSADDAVYKLGLFTNLNALK